MSDLTNHPVSPRPDDDKPISQRVAHQPVSARVPEKVARGVFSTGQLVLDSPKEFCLDFLYGLSRPYQVVARVIMAPATMSEFTSALEQNLGLYQQNFGLLPVAPTPVIPPLPPPRPTIEEIYQTFKLPDDLLPGAYANSVMISHSATEFCFDFIAGFYPTSVVTARILVSAPTAPRLLNTLRGSVANWRSRSVGGPTNPAETNLPPTPPQTPPPAEPGTNQS